MRGPIVAPQVASMCGDSDYSNSSWHLLNQASARAARGRTNLENIFVGVQCERLPTSYETTEQQTRRRINLQGMERTLVGLIGTNRNKQKILLH